jgi:hypothetical protein
VRTVSRMPRSAVSRASPGKVSACCGLNRSDLEHEALSLSSTLFCAQRGIGQPAGRYSSARRRAALSSSEPAECRDAASCTMAEWICLRLARVQRRPSAAQNRRRFASTDRGLAPPARPRWKSRIAPPLLAARAVKRVVKAWTNHGNSANAVHSSQVSPWRETSWKEPSAKGHYSTRSLTQIETLSAVRTTRPNAACIST